MHHKNANTPPLHTTGVASLEAFLHENADANAAKARALTGALPHLSSLHINFGARSDAAALAPFFSAVGGAARLRDVRVTSWVPLAPQKGAAPLGCFATLALGGVTSLTFDGAALSSSDMLVSTCVLRCVKEGGPQN